MPNADPTESVAYRERLWPAAWVFIATALVIPASLLVFLPISLEVGVAVAVGLYAAIVGVLIATTATVEVSGGVLRAGRARIELRHVGAVASYEGAEATAQRGVELDARAWLLVRGWITGVVRVEITDPADPTPYWLISSRRPAEVQRVLSL